MAAEEASISKCMRSPTPRELQQHGPSWVLAHESFGLGCYKLAFSFIGPEPKASFMPARVIEIAKRDKNGVFVSIVQVIARNNIMLLLEMKTTTKATLPWWVAGIRCAKEVRVSSDRAYTSNYTDLTSPSDRS
jgi:hypothetical protein